MKTTYITDNFSTLGGLGAVAYGDPEYFREVQNQVYAQSPSRFIDIQRPSDVFESLILNEESFKKVFLNTLEGEYSKDGTFTDYVDIELGPEWKQIILEQIYPAFQSAIDTNSSYGATLSDYFGLVIKKLLPQFSDQEALISIVTRDLRNNVFSSTGVDLGAQIISNNPQTKISTPPINSKIALETSVDLGLDYRGVPFNTGYSTIEDYWSDIPYPGVTSNNLIPATLRESLLNGYIGYSSQVPLENIYNPEGTNSISSFDLTSSDALNFSNPFGSGSILNQLPEELQGDKDVYSISLIGETINGYTTFDPKTMSNGDSIDASLIPDFEGQNADSDGGLPGLSRSFAFPF